MTHEQQLRVMRQVLEECRDSQPKELIERVERALAREEMLSRDARLRDGKLLSEQEYADAKCGWVRE